MLYPPCLTRRAYAAGLISGLLLWAVGAHAAPTRQSLPTYRVELFARSGPTLPSLSVLEDDGSASGTQTTRLTASLIHASTEAVTTTPLELLEPGLHYAAGPAKGGYAIGFVDGTAQGHGGTHPAYWTPDGQLHTLPN